MSEWRRDRAQAERLPVRRPQHESFAAALDSAIRERGLTQAALRRSLRLRGSSISAAALSYWRSGRRQPEGDASLEAVGRLEEVLGLPDGDLLDRIGPARRLVPQPERVPTRALFEVDDDMELAFTEQGLDTEDLLELSAHATTYLDRFRCIEKTVVRSLVRAAVDGADRIPLFLRLERPSDHPAVFRVLAGGRLVDDTELSPDFYSGALVLDRPLRRGETAMVEYEMVVPEASGFHYFEQHLDHRTNEVLIWVRFHPEAVPRICEAYQFLGDRESKARIDLAGVTSAHYSGRGVGPGTVGIRWEW